MKKLSNKNVEPLFERNLSLLMLFALWLILSKKYWKFLKKNPMIWWRYIDDKFSIWEDGDESLEIFIDQVNMFHPTIKFRRKHKTY